MNGCGMRILRSGSLLLVAVLLGGCAVRLTAIPVSERARLEMGSDTGIPYYVPRPYLLVTRDIELTDDALLEAGVVPDQNAGVSAVSIPVTTSVSADASGSSADAASTGDNSTQAEGQGEAVTAAGTIANVTAGTIAGTSPEGGTERPITFHTAPTYQFRVIYLPDLTRQYALQQRGGAFSSVTLRYELKGGWMFTGTELTAETRLPETIEATTTGLANILETQSIGQVFQKFFPSTSDGGDTSGVSGIGPRSTPRDKPPGPKIWLFEISDGPRGTLHINLEEPFFQWPLDDGDRTRRARDLPNPDIGDLFQSRPPVTKPTGSQSTDTIRPD